VIYPMIRDSGCGIRDGLRTYVEHIAIQIRNALASLISYSELPTPVPIAIGTRLLATGGGALNSFLIQRLGEIIKELNVKIIVPDERLINFKEALIMVFMGVLRWRQEYNVLSTVTGSKRDSIGGAIWNGQEA
jgi:anhydro-N-acetylmuramic acid kinase